MTSFGLRFNQGRREFKQEMLIEHFFLWFIMGDMKAIKSKKLDIMIQTINKLERNFGFSICTLCIKKVYIQTRIKILNKLVILMIMFDLTLLGHTYKNITAWITTITSIKNNLRSIRKQLKFNFYVTLLTLFFL